MTAHRSPAFIDPLRRACRACGCTDLTACVTATGPCAWVDDDLCTACGGVAARVLGADAVGYLLIRCGVLPDDARTSRPGGGPLTGEGLLALRRTLQALVLSTAHESRNA